MGDLELTLIRRTGVVDSSISNFDPVRQRIPGVSGPNKPRAGTQRTDRRRPRRALCGCRGDRQRRGSVRLLRSRRAFRDHRLHSDRSRFSHPRGRVAAA